MKALALLILLSSAAYADQGIIVSKIGAGRIFIFTGEVAEQKGQVKIGKTIEIRYWLRIDRNGRPRFIAVDGSSLPERALRKFNPSITPVGVQNKSKWVGGFFIKSSGQSKLDVIFTQKIWEPIGNAPTQEQLKAVEQTLSKVANLNVVIVKDKDQFKIARVIIN